MTDRDRPLRLLAQQVAEKIASECSGVDTNEQDEVVAVFVTADARDIIENVLQAVATEIRREQQAIYAPYLQHKDDCAWWPQFTSHFQQATKSSACTCGLAALAIPQTDQT